MADITIIGLGPGNFGALTQETLDILAKNERVYLRTIKHPVVDVLLQKGIIAGESFDDYYEKYDDFDEVYKEIALSLIGKALKAPLVYAVPGHPLVAEQSVNLIKEMAGERGLDVKIVPAMSFLDPLLNLVGFDPINGIQIIDALRLEEQSPQPTVANVLVQVYSRLIAQDVKILLMDYYPDEHLITVIRAAGVENEEQVSEIPLYELDRLDWVDYLTSVFIPPLNGVNRSKCNYPLDPLVEIMEELRGPNGCPWDKEQTHGSLKKYLLEETYEVLDALDEGKMNKVCEELGDLLLQIAFHAQIANETGNFDMNDVVDMISQKLIRRHPHVFDNIIVENSDEVNINWERIKEQEKKHQGVSNSLFADIPRNLPALLKAEKVQKRAAKIGFDWPDYKGALGKVYEEVSEVEEAISKKDYFKINDEIGDVFFALVNLARFFKVNPETALLDTIKKFFDRFQVMEKRADEIKVKLSDLSLEELDKLWEEAKNELNV